MKYLADKIVSAPQERSSAEPRAAQKRAPSVPQVRSRGASPRISPAASPSPTAPSSPVHPTTRPAASDGRAKPFSASNQNRKDRISSTLAKLSMLFLDHPSLLEALPTFAATLEAASARLDSFAPTAFYCVEGADAFAARTVTLGLLGCHCLPIPSPTATPEELSAASTLPQRRSLVIVHSVGTTVPTLSLGRIMASDFAVTLRHLPRPPLSRGIAAVAETFEFIMECSDEALSLFDTANDEDGLLLTASLGPKVKKDPLTPGQKEPSSGAAAVLDGAEGAVVFAEGLCPILDDGDDSISVAEWGHGSPRSATGVDGVDTTTAEDAASSRGTSSDESSVISSHEGDAKPFAWVVSSSIMDQSGRYGGGAGGPSSIAFDGRILVVPAGPAATAESPTSPFSAASQYLSAEILNDESIYIVITGLDSVEETIAGSGDMRWFGGEPTQRLILYVRAWISGAVLKGSRRSPTFGLGKVNFSNALLHPLAHSLWCRCAFLHTRGAIGAAVIDSTQLDHLEAAANNLQAVGKLAKNKSLHIEGEGGFGGLVQNVVSHMAQSKHQQQQPAAMTNAAQEEPSDVCSSKKPSMQLPMQTVYDWLEWAEGRGVLQDLDALSQRELEDFFEQSARMWRSSGGILTLDHMVQNIAASNGQIMLRTVIDYLHNGLSAGHAHLLKALSIEQSECEEAIKRKSTIEKEMSSVIKLMRAISESAFHLERRLFSITDDLFHRFWLLKVQHLRDIFAGTPAETFPDRFYEFVALLYKRYSDMCGELEKLRCHALCVDSAFSRIYSPPAEPLDLSEILAAEDKPAPSLALPCPTQWKHAGDVDDFEPVVQSRMSDASPDIKSVLDNVTEDSGNAARQEGHSRVTSTKTAISHLMHSDRIAIFRKVAEVVHDFLLTEVIAFLPYLTKHLQKILLHHMKHIISDVAEIDDIVGSLIDVTSGRKFENLNAQEFGSQLFSFDEHKCGVCLRELSANIVDNILVLCPSASATVETQLDAFLAAIRLSVQQIPPFEFLLCNWKEITNSLANPTYELEKDVRQYVAVLQEAATSHDEEITKLRDRASAIEAAIVCFEEQMKLMADELSSCEQSIKQTRTSPFTRDVTFRPEALDRW